MAVFLLEGQSQLLLSICHQSVSHWTPDEAVSEYSIVIFAIIWSFSHFYLILFILLAGFFFFLRVRFSYRQTYIPGLPQTP